MSEELTGTVATYGSGPAREGTGLAADLANLDAVDAPKDTVLVAVAQDELDEAFASPGVIRTR